MATLVRTIVDSYNAQFPIQMVTIELGYPRKTIVFSD